MRISDWSSDVCSSDLGGRRECEGPCHAAHAVRDEGHGLRGEPGDKHQDQPVAPRHVRRGEGGKRRKGRCAGQQQRRSEEHTSELQSLMRISYAVFCLKKKKKKIKDKPTISSTINTRRQKRRKQLQKN